MTRIVDIEALGALVAAGSKLALPTDYAGVSMAMTRDLIRRRVGALHVVCVPAGGMDVDMLIGAGLVATLETSAVSLGEAGAAPRFTRAAMSGSVTLLDATCPAIHAGLIAAQKGVPFLPLRGLLGTDVLRNRPDWRVIDNPFAAGSDPIVAIPAIVPDVAIFHAPMADRFGNVWIGRRRELATMAYAARRSLVTVERLVEEDLLGSELSAAGVLPSLYVDAVAEARHGAAPCGLWGEYKPDAAELARYAAMARTEAGFRDYLAGLGLTAAAS
jgi:glutaconate CoA-transferase subunit A